MNQLRAPGRPSSWVGRETYFHAAYGLLAESGYDAVTVAGLCARVHVTKGSFYHHFSDLDEFTKTFADWWSSGIIELLDSYDAEPDLGRRVALMANSHIVAMTGAEPAIRAWSRVEPDILAAMRRIEERGTAVSDNVHAALSGDRETAEMLTRVVISILIGLQQRVEEISGDRLVRIMGEWWRRCLHLDVHFDRTEITTMLRAAGGTPSEIPRYQVQTPNSTRLTIRHAELGPGGLSSTRGRKQDYFAAARDLLAERGSDGVTIAAICERLGVTHGAFHHAFSTMAGFVGALADEWLLASFGLLESYESERDPAARLEVLFHDKVTLLDPAEAAWQAWGWANPTVHYAVRHVQRRLQRHLTTTFAELGHDDEAAELLAEMGVALTLGLPHWEPALDLPTRESVVLEWLRRCVGVNVDVVHDGGTRRLSVATTLPRLPLSTER